MRRSAFFACLAALSFVPAASAQDTDFREELLFAEALRARGDNDLALEIIQRLRKVAPPELAKELPLEEAKTLLRVAGDEAETARRLRKYLDARTEFQKFIDANPGHPRLAEANLDIARLLNLIGRTELNQALLSDDIKTRRSLAAQSRATLVEAASKLAEALKALEIELAKAEDPDSIADAAKKKEATARRNQLELEVDRTKVERGLNLYDQSSTYLGGNDEAASKLLVAAKAILDPVAGKSSSAAWKAKAWVGRIVHQIESADNARKIFQQVILQGDTPVATEGVRLARYFQQLVNKEQPDDKLKVPGALQKFLLDSGTGWRARYPRHLKTPEGCGVTFLLAETLINEAGRVKVMSVQHLNNALNLLRELEQSENEFTDRARRLKIRTVSAQGGFTVPIEKLPDFERCYLRAQYEAFQMNQDPVEDIDAQLKRLPDLASLTDEKEKKKVEAERARLNAERKKLSDPDALEKKRKQHLDDLMKALVRGLGMPQVKTMKPTLELDNARAMISYWSLTTGKLEDAIKFGEAFARESPRSSQAAMSSVYALQGYTQLVAQKQAKFEEVAALRTSMMSLAHYMEDRWPGELAGEVAVHTVGLQLIRDENPREAIKKLSLISPSYGSYALTRFQIADVALKAERDKADPIDGDRPGDYRKRAMIALDSMPISALGPDPFTNHIYMSGKAILGRELFRNKRYAQMDELAAGLLGRLNALKFNDEEDKDRTIRNQLRYELVDIQLYARYGLADGALQANDFEKAAKLLDALIDQVAKADDSQEKTNLQKNPQLATLIMTTALKANLQMGKIDRTEVVLDALNKLGDDGQPANTTNLLKLLAFLIRGQVDEIRKSGNKAQLDTAIKGYTQILGKQIVKHKGEMKPDFLRVLADCYASMGEHGKAAAELGRIKIPAGKLSAEDDRMYKGIQLLHIRELRLSGTKEDLVKARKAMDEIRGEDKKPGWARQNPSALMEQGQLLEMEGKWDEAFRIWAGLVKQLVPRVKQGNPWKDWYFESSYHTVLCYTKVGLTRSAKEARDKDLRAAAQQIVNLERAWDDMGGDVSKKRFTDLLAAEPALKEQYDALKTKK